MTVRSPGRWATFLSVIGLAILSMCATEWRFILHAESTEGEVILVGQRSFTVNFQIGDEYFKLNSPINDGIPEVEKGERVSVRYLLNERNEIERAYVNWFWALFSGKLVLLCVASIPWFAFVWAMPAKWTFRLGKRKQAIDIDIDKLPEKGSHKRKRLNQGKE